MRNVKLLFVLSLCLTLFNVVPSKAANDPILLQEVSFKDTMIIYYDNIEYVEFGFRMINDDASIEVVTNLLQLPLDYLGTISMINQTYGAYTNLDLLIRGNRVDYMEFIGGAGDSTGGGGGILMSGNEDEIIKNDLILSNYKLHSLTLTVFEITISEIMLLNQTESLIGYNIAWEFWIQENEAFSFGINFMSLSYIVLILGFLGFNKRFYKL